MRSASRFPIGKHRKMLTGAMNNADEAFRAEWDALLKLQAPAALKLKKNMSGGRSEKPRIRRNSNRNPRCPGARSVLAAVVIIGVKNMKKLVLALALSGLATVAAHAAEMDYNKVDADANGAVSMEEAAAAGWEWTEDQFKAADTNADGALSAEEFAAVAK